jgi:hypothetical protein
MPRWKMDAGRNSRRENLPKRGTTLHRPIFASGMPRQHCDLFRN